MNVARSVVSDAAPIGPSHHTELGGSSEPPQVLLRETKRQVIDLALLRARQFDDGAHCIAM